MSEHRSGAGHALEQRGVRAADRVPVHEPPGPGPQGKEVQGLEERAREARRARACRAAPAAVGTGPLEVAHDHQLARQSRARVGAHDLEHVVLGLDTGHEQVVPPARQHQRLEDLRVLGQVGARAVLDHRRAPGVRSGAGHLRAHRRRIEHDVVCLAQGEALHDPQPQPRRRAPLPPAPLAAVHGHPHARPAAAREPARRVVDVSERIAVNGYTRTDAGAPHNLFAKPEDLLAVRTSVAPLPLFRYADDAVMLFEKEEDARRVLEVLPKRFAKYGLRREVYQAGFGLAENTLTVTRLGRRILTVQKQRLQRRRLSIHKTMARHNNLVSLVSCGRPSAGIDVRIVDPESRRALGEDAIGEIWIDGESKCAGYWQRPELTQHRGDLGDHGVAHRREPGGDQPKHADEDHRVAGDPMTVVDDSGSFLQGVEYFFNWLAKTRDQS